MVVIANVFSRLKTVKDLVEPISKNRRFITSYGSQHVKGPQHLWNLYERPFIILLDHSDEKWLGEYLPDGDLKS